MTETVPLFCLLPLWLCRGAASALKVRPGGHRSRQHLPLPSSARTSPGCGPLFAASKRLFAASFATCCFHAMACRPFAECTGTADPMDYGRCALSLQPLCTSAGPRHCHAFAGSALPPRIAALGTTAHAATFHTSAAFRASC